MDFIQFSEILMLVLFGVSWPFNIVKSLRSKSTKGKSVGFEFIIAAGYLAGIAGKIATLILTGVLPFSFWFYIADLGMVVLDISLYFRNRAYEHAHGL